MSMIADGECFASKIPQGKSNKPAMHEIYAIIFKDGSMRWANHDKSHFQNVLKCVRISWMSDGTLMPGDQKFTDVAKLVADCDHFPKLSLDQIEEIEALAAERDLWKLRAEEALTMLQKQGDKRDEAIARAESAEAEVERLQSGNAELVEDVSSLWRRRERSIVGKLEATIALYQPVIDAAVAWVSEDNRLDVFYPPAAAVYEAVRALKAAQAKGFCSKDRPSGIDDLGMKTEAEGQLGPDEDPPRMEVRDRGDWCPECSGEGWFVIDETDSLEGHTENRIPCPACSFKNVTPVEQAFAGAVPMLDAHLTRLERACSTCRHMDGEMCELSGAMAKACLDNDFPNWRCSVCGDRHAQIFPGLAAVNMLLEGHCLGNDAARTIAAARGSLAAPQTQEDVSSLYAGQDAEADLGIDGMGPNGPVLSEPPSDPIGLTHLKDAGEAVVAFLKRNTEVQAMVDASLQSLGIIAPNDPEVVKTCATCQFGPLDVLTEQPCISCQWPVLSNWAPKESSDDD